MDPKITDVTGDEDEVEPIGLSATEELENDPTAPTAGGMEVGKDANTTDDQRDLEIEQNISGVATVSESVQEQDRLSNPYGGEVTSEAQKKLFDNIQSGSGAELHAGTIESAAREREEFLLAEKEKQRNEFFTLLVSEGWPPALAELAADFEEMQEDFTEVEGDFDEIMAEANSTLENLQNEMTQLDSEYEDMQAQKTQLDEQVSALDQKIAEIDSQLPPDLEARLQAGELTEEDLTEEQKELLQERWMLESERDGLNSQSGVLEAEMNQNRAIQGVYSAAAENVGNQIRSAERSIGEARAQLADLNSQLREAKESGASDDAIQALENQKADVQNQIADAKQEVQDLSRQLDVTQRIAGYEFAVDVTQKEDNAGACFSPAMQAQIINGRTELITAVSAAMADGEISKEDIGKLYELTENAEVTQEDVQNLANLFGEEGSGITIDGKTGAEASAAMMSAWQELEGMKEEATADLRQAEAVHAEAKVVESAEAAETTEVIQDATSAITGMAEYGSVWEFMTDNYAPGEADGKENIIDVMNDHERYLRSGEGNLVYVSSEDQRMYTLGEDENGDATQNFLSHEETAELHRQVVEDGMIPRNYAFDGDREDMLDHLSSTNVLDSLGAFFTAPLDTLDVATSKVDVPEEYSPFDTWQDTFDASGDASTIATRHRLLVDSVQKQAMEGVAAVETATDAAQAAAEKAQEVRDIEQAQLLVEQTPGLSPEDALAQVQAERETLVAAEDGDADSDVWKENDQLDMETPDPNLVIAAGAIMNQVEGGQIPASRLNDVLESLSSLNLTDDQIDTLKQAIENDPDVTLVDDLDPNAPAWVSANAPPDAAEPIVTENKMVAGIIVPQTVIEVATSTPDANGIEPSETAYVSFADTEFTQMSHDPEAEAYNWVKPESIANNAGLAMSAMSNVLSQSSSSGSGAGTDTGAQPDPSLMMSEEQRLAAQNATMGANAGTGGGGMAG